VEENPETNWLDIYQEALDHAAGLNLDILAEGFLRIRDAKSFRGLISLHLDRGATLEEFNKRITLRNFGSKIMGFVEDKNDASINSLLSQIQYGISGLLRENKIPKGMNSYIIDLIKRLTTPSQISGDFREKEINEENHKEIRHEAFLIVMQCYENLKKNVKTKDWSNIRFSLISEFRKMEDSAWDKIAPRMLLEMIRKSLEFFLPILEGKIENMPYEVLKNDINRIRQELNWKVHQSWKNLGKISKKEEGEFNPRKLKLWGEKRIRSIEDLEDQDHPGPDYQNLKDGKRSAEEFIKNPYEILVDMEEEKERQKIEEEQKKKINEVIKRSKNPRIAKEILRLMSEGKSQKEIARKIGRTDRTIRNLILKIRIANPATKNKKYT
jgi:hypothetical protein